MLVRWCYDEPGMKEFGVLLVPPWNPCIDFSSPRVQMEGFTSVGSRSTHMSEVMYIRAINSPITLFS